MIRTVSIVLLLLFCLAALPASYLRAPLAAQATDGKDPVSSSESSGSRRASADVGNTARETAAARKPGEWPAYGADFANTKYSPLSQINKSNVKRLRIAWRWKSPDNELLARRKDLHTWLWESTPIMVDGVLYTSTSLSQVAAIDPVRGKTLWVYNPDSHKNGRPPNLGFVHRGVSYWSDGRDRRVIIATGDAYLIALDAKTGRPVTSFGDNGRVDLARGLRRPVDRRYYGVTSPPVICRDTVVVGASIFDLPAQQQMPPGDVRGFDARTGELLWTFHTIPEKGEFGAETWRDGSAERAGAANVWTTMSADEELGYVYLPVATPANDWYGGGRPGDNLFAEALVAVEARTGRRVWHYQVTRHGLWDYDLPAPPVLADIDIDGKKIRAAAQVTKQGFLFVLDRATGEPVWPVENREAPPSDVPGEAAAPTQPFPTRPAPFDRQGARAEDVIDFTPQLRAEALEILNKYKYGPVYTPPSERGTIILPGWVGGASWAGAAIDPASGRFFVPSITQPVVVALRRADSANALHAFTGRPVLLWGPDGLPLFKPPFGRITAIDLSTGEHAWMSVHGDGPRNHARLKGLNLPPLGWPRRGFVLATKSLLFAVQEGVRVGERPAASGNSLEAEFANDEPRLRAFDKATGALLAEIPLPANASGSPMTYQAGGKQYVVVATGGATQPAELIALALP